MYRFSFLSSLLNTFISSESQTGHAIKGKMQNARINSFQKNNTTRIMESSKDEDLLKFRQHFPTTDH